MARDYPRHRPPKHQPLSAPPFDDHPQEPSAEQPDLEQRLERDRRQMRKTHSNFYTDNNITGLDPSARNRGESDDPPYYDRDYSTQGYIRDHSLEHDPNRGRGQAYRYDYGRELYGREAYRDNYRSSEPDYRHSGPNYRGRGPKGYHRSDQQDRKSTRLNSSHVKISYAVFCLKKKK